MKHQMRFFTTLLGSFAMIISVVSALPAQADEPLCPGNLVPNWLFLPEDVKASNGKMMGSCTMVSETETSTTTTTGCLYSNSYLCLGEGYNGSEGIVSRPSCSPCPGGTTAAETKISCKGGLSLFGSTCGFKCRNGEVTRSENRCPPTVQCPDGSYAAYSIGRCYQICTDRSIASGTKLCVRCSNGTTTSDAKNCPNVCGDGIKKAPEVCDEGKDNDNPKKAIQRSGQPTKEYCSAKCDEWIPTCEEGEELKEVCTTVGQSSGVFRIAASPSCTKRCVRKTLLEQLLTNSKTDQCAVPSSAAVCAPSTQILSSIGVSATAWEKLPRTCAVRIWQSFSKSNSGAAQCGVDLCEYDKKPRAQPDTDQTIHAPTRCGEQRTGSDQTCASNEVNAYFVNPKVVGPGVSSIQWKSGISTFQGTIGPSKTISKLQESLQRTKGTDYATLECAANRRGCAPALQCESNPNVDVGMYVEGQKVGQLYLSDLLYRMAQLRIAPTKEYSDYDREVLPVEKEGEKQKEIPRFYAELSVRSTIIGRRRPITTGTLVAFYLYDDGGKNCLVMQDQTADDNVFSTQVGIIGDQNDAANPIPQDLTKVCQGETEFMRWAKFKRIITETPPTGEELVNKIGALMGTTLRVKVYRKKGEPVGMPPLALLEIPIEENTLNRPGVGPEISLDAIREYGLSYIKTISILMGPERIGPQQKPVPAVILDHLKDAAHQWLFSPEQTYGEPVSAPSMPSAPPMPYRSPSTVEQFVLNNGLFPHGQCNISDAANAGRCTAAFEEMKKEADFQFSAPPKIMVGEISGITNSSGSLVMKKMPNGSVYVLTAPGYDAQELKTRVNEFCQRNQCGTPWP